MKSELATLVTRRLDTILQSDDDSVIVCLDDPEVRNIVRCRSLAYAARYLRSVLADQAADLLEDRIAQLHGHVDDDPEKTVICTTAMAAAIASTPCPGTEWDMPQPRRSRRTLQRVSPMGQVRDQLGHQEVERFPWDTSENASFDD